MPEIAHLVIEWIVQAVHPHVAPEAVKAVFRAGGAGAHVFKDACGDFQRGAGRHHLGFADMQGHLGAFGSRQCRFFPGALQALGGVVRQQLGAAKKQPQLAITLLNKRIITGQGHTGSRPGAAVLTGVTQRSIQRALGITQIQLGQNQLRQARAQRGARADASGAEQLTAVDKDILELHRAAVGLALAKTIPVIIHRNPFALRGQHDKHPVFGVVATRHIDHEGIGTERAGAE